MTPSYEAGKPDPTAAPISLRRVGALPPYAIGGAAPPDPHGREVIDLGFGNPDLPSPAVAVERLATEARDPLAHRYVPGVGRREARTALSELRDSTIGIAGTGGIGGSTGLRLARMGVRSLKVADCDDFDATNMQRQVGAELHNLDRNKAEVIGEYAANISGDVDVDVFPQGITDDTAQQFVDGCDIVLDQIDVYTVDAHYALHEAFRNSRRCQCILTVLTIGHAAYVFKYTHDSMQIEEVYGLPKKSQDELTEKELRQLIGRIIPVQPDYPSRATFDRWWVEDHKVSIWGGTPPLCEGVLAERTALELMDFPAVTPLPVQPGYAIMDTRSWTTQLVSGAWWTNPSHPRND